MSWWKKMSRADWRRLGMKLVKSDSLLGKLLVFGVVSSLILIILLELGLRVVYFQIRGPGPLALIALTEQVGYTLSQRSVKSWLAEYGDPKDLGNKLYEEIGAELLTELKDKYRREFSGLVKSINGVDAKLMVVYIPSGTLSDEDVKSNENRRFYSNLADESKVDFIDLTEVISGYGPEEVFMLPLDGHLSKFGHRVVAKELSKYLEDEGHRSGMRLSEQGSLLGGLEPNQEGLWMQNPKLPYLVVTNGQGLRRSDEVTFPKTKARILVLGDSFTFSPYLPIEYSFVSLLDDWLEEFEVVNAGVSGYTISDEAALFEERAKYIQPDVVIVQVLDNDLFDLMFQNRRVFAVQDGPLTPSHTELEFLERAARE